MKTIDEFKSYLAIEIKIQKFVCGSWEAVEKERKLSHEEMITYYSGRGALAALKKVLDILS